MYKCLPKEIIQEVPNVISVALPHYWFDNVDIKRSVFTSLYEWMLQNERVPDDPSSTLHNRTYVGDKIYAKLRTAEKLRLAKTLKLKGEKLDEALMWSDVDTAPQSQIGEFEIAGDVILVIPESSREALGEYSLKITRRQRQGAIKKVRAKAAGCTFFQWLLSQVERPDHVGDLAREVADGGDTAPAVDDLHAINIFFGFERESKYQPSPRHGSFKDAWMEYLQQYPGRVKPSAWCSECDSRLDIKDARVAWGEETYELLVMDAGCVERYNGFDNMTSLPLAGITSVDLEQLAERDDVSELDVRWLEETVKMWGILPISSDEGTVYFIRSQKTHAIKIGFTAGMVEDRLKSLQTAHPCQLEVLGTLSGGRDYEKSLHRRFKSLALKGEWFEPHPDLLSFIALLPKP